MEASKSSYNTTNANSRCLVAIAITLILISSLPIAKCRPRDQGLPEKKEKFCEVDAVQQETCQKCAKVTKSPLVYPMCCNEVDGVYLWCNEYVYFAHETTSSSRQTSH